MSKIDRPALQASGAITAATLAIVAKAVKPGITTAELDQIAERAIREDKATPAFLGYRGFPSSLCTSVNEQVVHGIPGPRVLEEGDIVSLDLGVKVNGWYTDAAVTVPVGTIAAETRSLLQTTWEALSAGLQQVVPGKTVGDYGHAVQYLSESAGFGVVRDCVGHGVGRKLHEEPSIPNFGTPGTGPKFTPEMVVAVEPMLTIGAWEVETADDHWTVVTRDRSLAAHYEESVIVTADGPERLTPLPDVLQARNAGARLGKVTRNGSARSFVKDTRG